MSWNKNTIAVDEEGRKSNEVHKDWPENVSYLKQLLTLKKIKERVFFPEEVELMPYSDAQNEICKKAYATKIRLKWFGITPNFSGGFTILTYLQMSWKKNGVVVANTLNVHQPYLKFVQECKEIFEKLL